MSLDSNSYARAWLTVALLWFSGALNYLDRMMITTMHGSLTAAISMTDAQFGLLTTVFLIVYAALSPFAGFIADRWNRSRVVVISLFVWSLVTWLTAYAKTYDQLLATRVLMAIAEACCMPASLALIMDYHRSNTRSLATGVLLSGVMIGSALSGLGGVLAEHHGWTYAFSFFGLIGIAYAFVLSFLLRDPATEKSATAKAAGQSVRMGDALVSLGSNGSFLLVVLYWSLLGMGAWAVDGWMPTYMKEHFHLSQSAAGLNATAYINVASLFGMIIGGAWADRWSRRTERGRIYVPIIGLCIAGPAILLTANTGQLSLAIAGLVFFGLTRVFTDANMMPSLGLICDRRYCATAWGILSFVSCATGGIAIYIGGLLRDANVDVSHIFQATAGLVILCAGMLSFVRFRAQPST